MSDYDELLPAFIEESQQHLQTVEPDLLALERGGETVDPEIVNRIFRGVHSIKGASGFFGFGNIGRLSHVMENSLSRLRDGQLSLTDTFVDALLSGLDALKAMIDDIANSESFRIEDEVAMLQGLMDETADEDDGGGFVEVLAGPGTGDAGGKRFELSRREVERFLDEGLSLYAVTIYLNQDIRQGEKTPYSFINNMEIHGRYVDSFLDLGNVSSLTDCLDNELAFDFLFATRLSAAEVPEALDLPPDRVTRIDLEALRSDSGDEDAASLGPQPSDGSPQTSDGSPHEASRRDDVDAPPAAGAVDEASRGGDRPAEAEPAAAGDDGPRVPDRLRGAFQAEERIRVGVSFLNDLVNLAGELVLGRNQLLQAAQPLVKTTPGLNPVLQHISRVTSEMQEKIMRMRMQPLSLVFEKFQRVVRDLARKHNKEVRLVTKGGDVEVDKTIIEGLSDPLTHLIRNAVDHGIESPEERERLEKPRNGTIELIAFHQGGQVHLSIKDDGWGIDGDRVAQKAVDKGVISPRDMAEMDEAERVRLIFRPGFSTAETVTDLSGRGVGMDVVLTNIEHLGGTVDVKATVGKETRIQLILPLTLAIVSGLLIRAGDHHFILPEVDIHELVRVKPDEIDARIDVIQDAWVLRLRETLLPLIILNRVLGLDAAETGLTGRTTPLRVLVIRHGAARFGLVVDAIVNTEEIVVKPLPRYLKRMQCYSGVSILGNGQVSLILDVAGIVKKAAIRRIDEIGRETATDRESSGQGKEVQTLLLFDNGTPERFALPLELISRIERIPAAEIEVIRDQQFLQYDGKKLRLLYLEDHLPVNRPERSADDTLGIIVPKAVRHPMGIVFSEVINTVNTLVELDTETIMAQGLFGSAVLDGKITLLPDMYALFEMAAPDWFPPADAGQAAPRKYRVLLAEDTPFFRMVETEYLTSAGYEVRVAEDGRAALDILNEEPVDAAVLDIVMPRMDGWALIRAIRKDERLKDLPVMAVTSLGNEGDRSVATRGLDAGFDAWELKLDKTRLLETLERILNRPQGSK